MTLGELRVSFSAGSFRASVIGVAGGRVVIPCLPQLAGSVSVEGRDADGTSYSGDADVLPGTPVELVLEREER